MRRSAQCGSLALALALARCGGGVPRPVAIDTSADACSWCRMAISDVQFAAELIAPSEEPKLFDDLGCLRAYLAGGAVIPSGAVAFVADHRTHEFVPAHAALYAEVAGLATPMSSGLVAWADDRSRSADPLASQGSARSATEVFGPSGPPGMAR